MNADRFAAVLAAYGADPDRWPEGEREAALAHAAAAPEATRLLAEEGALDGLLDAAEAPAPSPAARTVLLAQMTAAGDRRRRAGPAAAARTGVVAETRRRAGLWLSGASLAAACAAGVLVGGRLAAPAPGDATLEATLSQTLASSDQSTAFGDAAAAAEARP